MVIPKRQRGGSITAEDIKQTLQSEGIQAEIEGNLNALPSHVAPFDKAGKGSLTFYLGDDEDAVSHLADCVMICKQPFKSIRDRVTFILVGDPRLCFAIIAQEFLPPLPQPGVDPTAIVDPASDIHPSAYIGPHCVIEKSKIGEGTVIHSGVKIYAGTEIGRNVEIESGAVVGASGVGRSVGPDGRHWLFPHFGKTIIEDDVFIGSCSIITRGVLGNTVLEKGCRINASVVIAHNCRIGKYTVVSIGVTISGSSVVGDGCFIGSSSALREGVRLGRNIVVGLGAVVTKSFEEDDIVIIGNPARLLKKE